MMTKFFLSKKSNILAKDLYHYTKTSQPGRYEQRKIMATGEPDRNPRIITVHDDQSVPAVRGWIDQQISPSHWLEIPPAGSGAYLGFGPAENNPPPYIWRNVLLKDNADNIELVEGLRQQLPIIILSNLRQQGYQTAPVKAKDKLKRNAKYFWLAGARVSYNLIEHIKYSFNKNDLPESGFDKLKKFKNPELVFQLNRHLSEGFIEGNAHYAFGLTESGKYNVSYNNREGWRDALFRAQVGQTLDDNSLTEAEKDGLNPLVDAVDDYLELPDFFEDILLDLVFQLTTPGETPQQEFAFWHLHYPHWYVDLVFALQQYEPHLSKQDWETIAEIVALSFPPAGSAYDVVLSLLLESAGIVGIDLPSMVTFMIDYVFEDVQKKAFPPP